MRAWQRWQEAQSTLQKKREAEAKLLWANKPDKLQQAKEEITEVTVAVTTQLMQHSKSLVYTKMDFKGFSGQFDKRVTGTQTKKFHLKYFVILF